MQPRWAEETSIKNNKNSTVSKLLTCIYKKNSLSLAKTQSRTKTETQATPRGKAESQTQTKTGLKSSS